MFIYENFKLWPWWNGVRGSLPKSRKTPIVWYHRVKKTLLTHVFFTLWWYTSFWTSRLDEKKSIVKIIIVQPPLSKWQLKKVNGLKVAYTHLIIFIRLTATDFSNRGYVCSVITISKFDVLGRGLPRKNHYCVIHHFEGLGWKKNQP